MAKPIIARNSTGGIGRSGRGITSQATSKTPDQDLTDLATQDYVVLGMVRLGARTGYEIKQMVEESVRFFWTISHVQIYPALRRLEEHGLVTGKDDPRGQRPRRIYDISHAGERALADWLLEPGAIPFELRDLGMVKLFFADALDETQARTLVFEVKERSLGRLAVLRVIGLPTRAPGNGTIRYPFLTLQLGIALHQAIVDACDDFERNVLKLRS